jgi:vesicle coat complex subunit
MALSSKLNHVDPDVRMDAADALAEQYERGNFKSKDLTAELAGLLELAVTERDADVQEALLNALNHGLIRFTADASQFVWQPLLDALPRLHPVSLAQALPILSLSAVPGIGDVIRKYVNHTNESVREAASFALDELEMMGG